jgi:hypothetical protein
LTEVPPAEQSAGMIVAYHSACSMQHGQRVTVQPKMLLENAGFSVRDIPEGHICCGSAGTYNILQPEIALRLRDRKVQNIERVAPDVIATGNIGCMTQIGPATIIPIVHTVELLDWAHGGVRGGVMPNAAARGQAEPPRRRSSPLTRPLPTRGRGAGRAFPLPKKTYPRRKNRAYPPHAALHRGSVSTGTSWGERAVLAACRLSEPA